MSASKIGYYILQPREPEDPEAPEIASFSYDRDIQDRSWFRGLCFHNPPHEPVQVTTQGGELPDLSEVPLPLVSKRLADALKSAGVSNIDYYTAEIRNETTDENFCTYFAFNLVGLVAAADLSASNYDAPEGPLISVDFESLVIDEEKVRGVLMFRLAECVTAIVVHESVKRAIEAAGIDTLDFVPPEEWVG
jgi:hypothetical protein